MTLHDNALRKTLLAGLSFVLILILLPQETQAAPLNWREKAREHEKQAQWLEASRCYEELLRKDRNQPTLRESHLNCLRRYHLQARHQDSAYQEAVARLGSTQALSLYTRVLDAISEVYVDRARTEPTALFVQGIRELRLALEDKSFRKQYLRGVSDARINAFKDKLDTWTPRRLANSRDAVGRIMEILQSAWDLGLPRGTLFIAAVGMEFAAGACNALDEYSAFLSPRPLSLVQGTLRGRLVGVGVELATLEDRLVVQRVYPNSPARELGLQRHDRILRVDRQPVEQLPAEAVAERLRGESGTAVEIEILRGESERKVVRLVRRACMLPAIEAERDADDPSQGIIRINYFSDTTAQEVREALAPWLTGLDPVTGIVLDLRGNPGGPYLSAVAVAELFLAEGTILHVHSNLRTHQRIHRVTEEGPASHLPVVVLVDGETASAAEILAGALKDQREGRTWLAGQTTFGKGTIQFFVQTERTALEKLPGGIRITAARFTSPTQQPIQGVGITPTHPLTTEGEIAVSDAKKLLKALTELRSMMMS